MNNSTTDTPHILNDKWPPRLKDDGLSLMQLIAHEYILRLIETAEGVLRDSAFHVRLPSNYTADKATHAYAAILAACEEPSKQIFTGGLQIEFPAHTVDHQHRDFQHAQRLINYHVDGKNTMELDQNLFHVGIIGAGMAGLYTAMILKSLDISYEILEASDRIGGRVYTHRFSNAPGDYYDVGAMRFPDTPTMDRTFRLFRQLGIEKKLTDYKTFDAKAPERDHIHPPEDRRKQSQKHGDLITYHLVGNNTPAYFNDNLVNVRPHPPLVSPTRVDLNTPPVVPKAVDEDLAPENFDARVSDEVDPDSFSTTNDGKVYSQILDDGELKVVNIFEAWCKGFEADPYRTLKELYDGDKWAVTVKQELMARATSKVKYTDKRWVSGDDFSLLKDHELTASEKYHISSWCETMLNSTCRYDRVIFESFMNSLDLSYAVASADDLPSVNDRPNIWWCLNGGTDVLAQEMTKNVGKDTIKMNARVTAIRKHPFLSHRPMRVLVEGCPTERRYSHVITTTTTPCLQAMDLSGVELQDDQKQAIRVLRYEAAVKLGIKFSKKWWIKLGINKGGVGKTDRPTRTVVYPSYALQEPEDGEGVLLACYNSSEDAMHIGGLAHGNDPTNQTLILNVVLHDLALMHNISYKTLRDLVVAHHFYDWSQNEFAGGAWIDFAPGQFSNFFTSLQVPAAGGNLFFAGELTSIYHGWVVGALSSAHRAVFLMLLKEKQYKLLNVLVEKWGHLTEHDIPSALCFVSISQRAERFATLREEVAVNEARQSAHDRPVARKAAEDDEGIRAMENMASAQIEILRRTGLNQSRILPN